MTAGVFDQGLEVEGRFWLRRRLLLGHASVGAAPSASRAARGTSGMVPASSTGRFIQSSNLLQQHSCRRGALGFSRGRPEDRQLSADGRPDDRPSLTQSRRFSDRARAWRPRRAGHPGHAHRAIRRIRALTVVAPTRGERALRGGLRRSRPRRGTPLRRPELLIARGLTIAALAGAEQARRRSWSRRSLGCRYRYRSSPGPSRSVRCSPHRSVRRSGMGMKPLFEKSPI